jgi:hypothetical protein
MWTRLTRVEKNEVERRISEIVKNASSPNRPTFLLRIEKRISEAFIQYDKMYHRRVLMSEFKSRIKDSTASTGYLFKALNNLYEYELRAVDFFLIRQFLLREYYTKNDDQLECNIGFINLFANTKQEEYLEFCLKDIREDDLQEFFASMDVSRFKGPLKFSHQSRVFDLYLNFLVKQDYKVIKHVRGFLELDSISFNECLLKDPAVCFKLAYLLLETSDYKHIEELVERMFYAYTDNTEDLIILENLLFRNNFISNRVYTKFFDYKILFFARNCQTELGEYDKDLILFRETRHLLERKPGVLSNYVKIQRRLIDNSPIDDLALEVQQGEPHPFFESHDRFLTKLGVIS